MFIEITKEVCERWTDTMDSLDDTNLILNDLFNSMIQKKHIIYLDRNSINNIISTCKFINPANKRLLCWMKNHLNDLHAVKRKIKTHVVVTLEEFHKTENVFYVPLTWLRNIEESKFLCENEDDYEFYLKLHNFFKQDNFSSIYLSNRSFHGGNFKSTFEYEAGRQSFVLSIVDSDRNYKDGKRGSTCHTAEDCFRNANNLVGFLYIINCKEKENLFPYSLYAEGNRDKCLWVNTIINTCNSEEQLRYVDIKDGIKTKWCKDLRFREKYMVLLEQMAKDGLCTKSCINKDDGYCLTGIGGDLLKIVATTFFEENNCKITLDSIKFAKIFGLQSFIIDDWREIAQHIYDFGCCVSQNTKFNV